MMSAWELPQTLLVGGKEWKIRTDFRAVLDILLSFSDPEYEDDEKWLICLDILYPDFGMGSGSLPPGLHQEAAEQAVKFIDAGITDDGRPRPTLMDWEQDAPLIIPAVNRILGKEVRSVPYMHWWTFLGAYMEIGDSTFSQVLNIRQKKSKHKKLEKWEQEYYRENKALIDLKKKYSEKEKEEQERLKRILDS